MPLLLVYSDFSLMALRVVLGIILITHGWPKLRSLSGTGKIFENQGVRPGIFWATLAAFLEFFGGIALVSGFFAQIVAIPLFFEFLAILIWKVAKKKPFRGGLEFYLLILVSLLVLMSMGGGKFISTPIHF